MKKTISNPYVKIFILGFFTALCLFLPYIIVDKGFFLYAGDFNSQQIPFYMYANRMVHSGSMNWSWATDLGSSFVNSFSFYLLGSPFFWLSTLFPFMLSPYLMPLWLMLKFAFASLGAFCFLRRYAKNDNFAFVGAILYAFSGFSVYNIFFNHFLESVAFFPFLLWSLDEFIYEKKRAIFPLFVALNLINNYFFFVGQVVFLAIYFICKVVSKEYKITFKEFWQLAFESVTGCLMGIVLFVPALLNLLQNPRTTSTQQGFGLWMYSTVQQYFAIAMSAFLPPESPYSPNLFTQGNIKWTSISAFVVLGGMFGYFIFWKYFKGSAFTKIFSTCIIFAFVPILNSSFYGFNSGYYARWFYMPLLILAAMNMQSFALEKDKIYFGIKTTAILTGVFLVFGLTPTFLDGKFKLGLQEELAPFWLYILIAFFSLYLLFLVVANFHGKPKYSQKLLMAALCVTLLFGTIHMCIVKLPQFSADQRYKGQNYDVIPDFDLKDNATNFRLDAYQCYNNLNLFLDMPLLQSFNSVVTPSIMEFYPSVGTKRDVSSKPDFKDFELRSLLSVKYLLMPTHEVKHFTDDGFMKGYTKYMDISPYEVFENEYFVPMGFTYDYFVTESQLGQTLAENRSNILMRAVMVEETDVYRYDLALERIDDNELFNYSLAAFEGAVEDRRASACYEFSRNDDGFTSKIKLDDGNLVFYSVPYDKGFTAYVNGEKAEILKVNYGLSAVYAPGGDNTIEFVYRTPGLNLGFALSGFGIAAYLIYFVIIKKKRI
ncbi:MAG: YfhO family protein [Oscillospiraceae bacterium]